MPGIGPLKLARCGAAGAGAEAVPGIGPLKLARCVAAGAEFWAGACGLAGVGSCARFWDVGTAPGSGALGTVEPVELGKGVD